MRVIPRLPMVRRDADSKDDSWFRVYHKIGPQPYMTFGQLVHGARETVWWLRDHAAAFPNASVIGIFEVEI